MKTIIKNPASILIIALLGFILITPAVATAGRDHHRHGDNHYYDRHDYGHEHRHYKRHRKHNQHRHYRSYGQPRGHYYTQQRYNIGYNQYPQRGYNSYYQSQPYGYRPNVSLGINAGNTSFMLRY